MWGRVVRTLAGQREMGLQSIPACSVKLVPLREEIPRNEAGEVLDCTVRLQPSREYPEGMRSCQAVLMHLVAAERGVPDFQALRDEGVEDDLRRDTSHVTRGEGGWWWSRSKKDEVNQAHKHPLAPVYGRRRTYNR